MNYAERRSALLAHLRLGGEVTLHLRAKRPAHLPAACAGLPPVQNKHWRWVETKPFSCVVGAVAKTELTPPPSYGSWAGWVGGDGCPTFRWNDKTRRGVMLRLRGAVYTVVGLRPPEHVQVALLAYEFNERKKRLERDSTWPGRIPKRPILRTKRIWLGKRP